MAVFIQKLLFLWDNLTTEGLLYFRELYAIVVHYFVPHSLCY